MTTEYYGGAGRGAGGRRPTKLRRADIDIVSFDRATFFSEVFDYIPGDHATFLAPSGGGKTQIAFEALGYTASPDLQATVFVMKPKDSTVTRWARAHGFQTVRDWPPSTVKWRNRVLGRKPAGYVLWPPETGNPDLDDARHEAIFRRALRMMYNQARKRPTIKFVDEVYSMEHELHLSKELVRTWTKGRSVGDGQWAASQRPAYISPWAYQAQHLFIGFEPDERSRDRYGDIGAGFDPKMVKALVEGLDRYEFLYISREERTMCIVEAA